MLPRWGSCLRGTIAPGTPWRTRGGHDAIPDGMIPPGLWAAASPTRPPALILRDGRCRIRLTRQPPDWHRLDVRTDRYRFLRWRRRLGLGLLLRQLTRMDDDKAQALLRHAPVTVLHLHLAYHTVAMPAARHGVQRPSRLLSQERQRRLWASPRFPCLPDSPGARDEGHSAHPPFAAQPLGPATIGCTLRHDPTDSVPASRQACLKGQRRCHTVTPVAIPQAHPHGEATIPTHPETQEHLLEISAPVCAVPRGGSGGRAFGGRFFIHHCILRCSDETEPSAPQQGVLARAPPSTAVAWAALLW